MRNMDIWETARRIPLMSKPQKNSKLADETANRYFLNKNRNNAYKFPPDRFDIIKTLPYKTVNFLHLRIL